MKWVVLYSLFNKLWYTKRQINSRPWKCLSFLYSPRKMKKLHLISRKCPYTDIFHIFFRVYWKILAEKLAEISIFDALIGKWYCFDNWNAISISYWWLFKFKLNHFFTNYCSSLVLKIPKNILYNCSIYDQLFLFIKSVYCGHGFISWY